MKKIFIVFISTILSLVLIDTVLRTIHFPLTNYVWKWATIGMFTPDNKRIYAFKPFAKNADNTQTIDGNGFRFNPIHYTPKTRMMVFGDSFVYGYKMDDTNTFPYIAQKELDSQDKHIYIINAGVSGYGPDQTYEYIREAIPKYKPNIIVWFINVNDIGDSNYACLYSKNIFGKYVELPIWLQTLYLQGVIVHNSPAYIRTSPLINIAIHALQRGPERRTIGCTLPDDDPRVLSQGIDKLLYFMDTITRIAEQNHIIIRYVLLPAEYYFNPSLAPNTSQQMKTYNALKKILSAKENTFIDMNEIFAYYFHSNLLTIRNSNVSKISPYLNPDTPDINVLGASIQNSSQIFLANDGEPGFSHLNEQGNLLLGTLFAKYILSDQVINSL